MTDCPTDMYGPQCSLPCQCDQTYEFCDNIHGQCYSQSEFTFIANLHTNRYTFNYFMSAQEELKENIALLAWNCMAEGGEGVKSKCLDRNNSDYNHLSMGTGGNNKLDDKKVVQLINSYFVRILDMKSRFSSTNEEITVVTMVMLNNTKPVNGSQVTEFLAELPIDVLSKALNYDYYRGDTYPRKRILDSIIPKMKWIVIGLSGEQIGLSFFHLNFVKILHKVFRTNPVKSSNKLGSLLLKVSWEFSNFFLT